VFELDYLAQKEMQYRESVLYPQRAREQRLMQEYRRAQPSPRRGSISCWLGVRLMRLGRRLAGPVEQSTTGPMSPSMPPS
jgi:hypothetical protein